MGVCVFFLIKDPMLHPSLWSPAFLRSGLQFRGRPVPLLAQGETLRKRPLQHGFPLRFRFQWTPHQKKKKTAARLRFTSSAAGRRFSMADNEKVMARQFRSPQATRRRVVEVFRVPLCPRLNVRVFRGPACQQILSAIQYPSKHQHPTPIGILATSCV